MSNSISTSTGAAASAASDSVNLKIATGADLAAYQERAEAVKSEVFEARKVANSISKRLGEVPKQILPAEGDNRVAVINSHLFAFGNLVGFGDVDFGSSPDLEDFARAVEKAEANLGLAKYRLSAAENLLAEIS